MELKKNFKNVFTYSAGIEKWVKDAYLEVSGRVLTMTFPMDFAIADWYGEKDVKETYLNVKESWLGDYKAFTQAALSLIYLSYANAQLARQGIEGRDKYVKLYEDLFKKADKDFHERYKGNDEALEWWFDWTD